ncbi:MAG: signal peptidase II [Christensenellaceae bacterium]|jgi:signal peptidase II|nr:signal peptidase II [Christensenellaceae bacterium]
MLIFVISFCAFALLDVLSKTFVFLGENGVIIPNLFSVYKTINTGAGWGFLSGAGVFARIFFCALAVAVLVIVIVWFFRRRDNNKFLAISLGMFCGGVFGNLYDRAVYGGVRDFISFDLINAPFFNTSFNLADAFITVGAVLLLVWFLKNYKTLDEEAESEAKTQRDTPSAAEGEAKNEDKAK